MDQQMTFPTILEPYCASLLQKAALKSSNLEIWDAVVRLLKEYDHIKITQQEYDLASNITSAPVISQKTVGYLKKDWESIFFPKSLGDS